MALRAVAPLQICGTQTEEGRDPGRLEVPAEGCPVPLVVSSGFWGSAFLERLRHIAGASVAQLPISVVVDEFSSFFLSSLDDLAGWSCR